MLARLLMKSPAALIRYFEIGNIIAIHDDYLNAPILHWEVMMPSVNEVAIHLMTGMPMHGNLNKA